LARSTSCIAVAKFLHISNDSVRRWDKEILEETLGTVDLKDVKAFLIDEKAIGKFHNYVTLVLNAENGQLWNCTTYCEAYTFLKSWYLKCVESELQPFISFAKGLLDAKKEIGNILEDKYSNGRMEAFNGIVARIIGRGYGYHDTRYLFLKCRQQSCSHG